METIFVVESNLGYWFAVTQNELARMKYNKIVATLHVNNEKEAKEIVLSHNNKVRK